MKPRSILPCVFLMCLGLSIAAYAQKAAQNPGTAQHTAPSTLNPQQANIQEYIELLRSDVRHQKAEVMGAVMQLGIEQSAKFWPVYSEYDAELAKLNDARIANIQEYARNYDQMTDAKADELVQSALLYHKQRSELLAKYYSRMKDSLGAVEAARFLQIESQLLAIIDLQIASSLPVVPQGS